MTVEKTIASLAMTATIFESRKYQSYFDIFIPLIAMAILESNVETSSKFVFEINEFSILKNLLENATGIKFPISVIKRIVDRCKTIGLVKQEYNSITFNKEMIYEFDRRDEIKKFLAFRNEIAEKFISFLQSNGLVDNQEMINKEDICRDLFGFISKNPLALPRNMLDESIDLEKIKRREYVLVARFIRYSQINDYDTFAKINELSIGSIVTNSILSGYVENTGPNLSNLNLYLDTRIIIGLLGFHGKAEEDEMVEFIDQCKIYKVNLLVFEETLDEVIANFNDAMRQLRGNLAKKNKIAVNMLKEGKSSSYIEIAIPSLENRLSKLGISKWYNRRPRVEVDDHYNIDIFA